MHGEYKMPGGKLVVVDLEVRDGRLADVQVSGDFFLEPDSALDAINRALDGQPGDADEAALTAALQRALAGDVMMYGLSAQAIAIAVRRAVDEEGTEAAAATGVTVGVTSARIGRPVSFVVNRPFIYALRDAKTGLVLFLGIVRSPR